MKIYSIISIVLVVVVINYVSDVGANPFGLLRALSGTTQNAQNSLSQGERNRSLEFVRTVLVTPLYGPGISYKFGLLSRLFRQFQQIPENRPGTSQAHGNAGVLPNSISKTLHFNRGITVTSPTDRDATITHATISTTQTSNSVAEHKESNLANTDDKDTDLDKDEEKVEEKESDKDLDDDAEKDSEKDTDKKDSDKEDSDKEDSEKDLEKDSDKEDSDKDKETEKESENNSDKDADSELALDSAIALIHKADSPSGSKTISNFTISTINRSDFDDSKKDTKGSDDKDAEPSNNTNNLSVSSGNNNVQKGSGGYNYGANNKIPESGSRSDNVQKSGGGYQYAANDAKELNDKLSETSSRSDSASTGGTNLTGSGGYHYAPRGYRYTRTGPTFVFTPSEILNTLTG